ncbi:MAG: ATP-binding cassette domain-containing protein [Anaerolineae bacterium]|nr:ATP-binding cassette domain-containing protein [Anaerolineae bacterium]
MHIRIEGANEHNLKDVDVDIGDGLTVVTGVSGSGKTSLVFDTLYHEARRRFLEVFSLGERLSPADVRTVTGVGPTVAVGQNLLNRNPGSTLATASGLHPFFRLLYTHFGERACAVCGAPVSVHAEDEILGRLAAMLEEGPLTVVAPLIRQAPGSHTALLSMLIEAFGAGAVWVDGVALDESAAPPTLEAGQCHDLDIVVAHLRRHAAVGEVRGALTDVWALGANAVSACRGARTVTLSRAPVCIRCGTWFGDISPVLFHQPCPTCNGAGCEACDSTGLHPAALAVRWQGLRLPELLGQSVLEIQNLVSGAELPTTASRLEAEIVRRLDALARVGLGYIALDRPSPTLSRGESQRVRLAVALTSRLEDIVHVLDEPTIGQHPADVARLLPAFRELGGPVIYVEHDRVAAAAADHALDLGPGAGRAGGQVTYSGTPAGLWESDTPTGRYFSLRERVTLPELRSAPEAFLTVRGACLRNLRAIDVGIPLERLTVISGVSGSGKSTFVEDVLAASLLGNAPVGCDRIEGPPLKAVMVDQSPIGRNPRSNPATYTKLSDIVRDLFAEATGLSASHFSFNRPEGACPACQGIGAVEVTMRYLPSTWIPCAACEGKRFSDEVLAATVAFGDDVLTIADFYGLTIAEVVPSVLQTPYLTPQQKRAAGPILQALRDIGLGYLTLGQPSPTLSGGEAQRVKLAKFLGRRGLSDQMLILDEPSTGLHPQDVSGLLKVLDRLVRVGATVVIVEHNTDIIRAADWVIDLGPGAGPEGGQLLYAGPPSGLPAVERSITGQALRDEALVSPRGNGVSEDPSQSFCTLQGVGEIRVQGARANNLQDLNVTFPKGKFTVVTGVSGSGKSSLVEDVLESEARRRFLETLSMYERQGTREGAEADVDAITGLGVTVTVGGGGRGHFGRRNTVGTATNLTHHLAVLFSWLGERDCPNCGTPLLRVAASRYTARQQRGGTWECPTCAATFQVGAPRHFSSSVYAAACTTCHGLGTLREPNPNKLVVHPELPLCGGAMHSPGFFPKGYLCQPMNGGYEAVQALGKALGFDPATTPWVEMSPEAQHAFLFGYPEELDIIHESRSGTTRVHRGHCPGFYGWVRDWDTGGTYTDTRICPACGGARLRPEYASVKLGGHPFHAICEMPLASLAAAMREIGATGITEREGRHVAATVTASLDTVRERLHFLSRVGLGYLHLNRDTTTLSAGEAQRVKLAGLLGSGLTSLTVLVDEPTRGMHPSEVVALTGALTDLCAEGNTVIVVEHDPGVIRAADYLIDIGPGAGAAGGQVVAAGSPDTVLQSQTLTALWLRGDRGLDLQRSRRAPAAWMTIRGARENNLRGEDVRLPLGVLAGICGVSGSGKSTLLIDTLGRALAPRKHTTSVAFEPIDPGAHDAIEDAPSRVLVVDQAKAGVTSPADFLGLAQPLHRIYAETEDAQVLGLDAKALAERCSTCGGCGVSTLDMGFLPSVHVPCETCRGTGYRPESWDVYLHGVALPDAFGKTIDEIAVLLRDHLDDEPSLARKLRAVQDVGLGYLVLRQPGYSLSGGEAQRLKIADELCRPAHTGTLYILDEPTVGQHLEDVARLIRVLHRVVDDGNSVFVVEHHTLLLAACDWLVEFGPGAGPDGGRVVAQGAPEALAGGDTPTAHYLRGELSDRPNKRKSE